MLFLKLNFSLLLIGSFLTDIDEEDDDVLHGDDYVIEGASRVRTRDGGDGGQMQSVSPGHIWWR